MANITQTTQTTETEARTGQKPSRKHIVRDADGASVRPSYVTPWLQLRPTRPDPELPQLVPTGITRRFLVDLLVARYHELYGDPGAPSGAGSHQS